MTYEEYAKKYESLLAKMLSYSCEQAGSNIYCSELADLEEAYPDHAATYDMRFEIAAEEHEMAELASDYE